MTIDLPDLMISRPLKMETMSEKEQSMLQIPVFSVLWIDASLVLLGGGGGMAGTGVASGVKLSRVDPTDGSLEPQSFLDTRDRIVYAMAYNAKVCLGFERAQEVVRFAIFIMCLT